MGNSASSSFDVIVVGLGAMGSAAAYHLARRGQRVLGLDAHPAGHTLGSSHGETRIIREAYFEHPDYVPLVRRAYTLWEQLERDSGAHLLQITGGLFVGRPDGRLVSGSLRSAREHGVPHTLMDAVDIRRRFPVFEARPHEAGLYEERAGVLFAERCIEAHLSLAAGAGATLRHSEPVLKWHATRDRVSIETASANYEAASLVLALGAWAGKLAGLPVVAERIPLYWFEPVREVGEMPIWIWQDPTHGDFFGTPHYAWPGIKVGKHHSHDIVDPDAVDREIHPSDEAPVRAFLADTMPALNGPVADVRVCLYENSPDTHFIVDQLPELPNVIYAAGFSGHGFKFASVIGEILSDLAITHQLPKEANFLRAARFSGPSNATGAPR